MSKARTKKTKDAADDVQVVWEYMRSQNRPYNQKNVFDNIHGKDKGISQAKVTKILDDLVTQGKLKVKNFKNKNVYWVTQEEFKVLDCSEQGLKEVETNIENLKNQSNELTTTVKELEQRNRELKEQPVNQQIDAIIEEVNQQLIQVRSELDKLAQTRKPVDEQKKKEIQTSYNTTKQEWKKRKRIFSDIWGVLSESMDAKKAKKTMVNRN
uniref:Homologous-pairing protein 2 winged helix domain-containing protein n=1 Tax=Arcella intermedia TaxID=1963864 RepID=A0A6B2LIA5_9EUKA